MFWSMWRRLVIVPILERDALPKNESTSTDYNWIEMLLIRRTRLSANDVVDVWALYSTY